MLISFFAHGALHHWFDDGIIFNEDWIVVEGVRSEQTNLKIFVEGIHHNQIDTIIRYVCRELTSSCG